MMRLRTAAALLLLVASAAFAGEVEKLVDQMGGADQSARYPAYRTLLERRDPSTAGPIAERIASWDVSAQSYGVSVLQSLPADATEAVWKRLASSSAPYVRVVAARQIADRERGAKIVVEVLSTPGLAPDVLEWVLSRVGGMREAAVLKAVRALVRADAPPDVLTAALVALANSDDRAAAPVVRALARDGDARRRALAAAWLLRAGEEDLAAALADALKSGVVPYMDFVRMRPWLEAAERIPAPILEAITGRLAAETAPHHVAAMCELLGRARHAPAIPELRKLLESPEATVSLAAFEALSSIPGALDRESLRSQLESKDAARRLAAAEALRRADDLSGMSVVIALVRTPNPVRWQAADALGAYRTDEVVEPLLVAMTCDDPTVRTYASSSLSNVLRTLFPYRRLDFESAGYRTDADAASQSRAVETIRRWWLDHRGRSW